MCTVRMQATFARGEVHASLKAMELSSLASPLSRLLYDLAMLLMQALCILVRVIYLVVGLSLWCAIALLVTGRLPWIIRRAF